MSFSCCCNPHRFFQSAILRLYFPALEPWVVWSVLHRSCSSQFIHTRMWDHPVLQAPPCPPRSSSHRLAACPFHPSFPSPSLLRVWMSISSLTPCLSDFHTVWFSGRSGYFLFLNLWLSFFCLCEEAKCIYLRLHLGWKSDFILVKFVTAVSCSIT